MTDVGIPAIGEYSNLIGYSFTVQEQTTLLFYTKLVIPSTVSLKIPANSLVRIVK